MKSLITFLILLVCLPVSTAGQGLSPDELERRSAKATGRKYVKSEPVDWTVIERHFESAYVGIGITCDIISDPQPLVPGKATIVLTALSTPPLTPDEDYVVTIDYPSLRLDWLTDKEYLWKTPANSGEPLTITVEFVALESGPQYFDVLVKSVRSMGMQDRLLCVQWCLDATGELIYMMRVSHPCVGKPSPIRTVFFDSEEVVVSRYEPSESPYSLFNWHYTITPPLQIGDTSTIRYYLTPNRDMTDGLDYRFSTVHMKIVKLPENLFDRAIAAGETIELAVDVVPAAVRNVQTIDLLIGKIFKWYRGNDRQTVKCEAIFNDDGSLRYIYTRGLGALDDSLYPTTFPEAETNGAWRSRLFDKDGPLPDSTDLR